VTFKVRPYCYDMLFFSNNLRTVRLRYFAVRLTSL